MCERKIWAKRASGELYLNAQDRWHEASLKSRGFNAALKCGIFNASLSSQENSNFKDFMIKTRDVPFRQDNPENIKSEDVNNVSKTTTCPDTAARIFDHEIKWLNLTKTWNPGHICGGESTKYSGNP
jgi:hypothetical protein